jgi:predicted transposase YbfD/YdcC
MDSTPVGTIGKHFADLEDPRVDRTKLHPLLDIITVAICAVICGADTWVEVEDYGKAKEEWLKGFLQLPNGIPSHDTFGRVFASLDPEQFEDCFLRWIQAVSVITEGQVVAIDGKTLRRSHDRTLGKEAIQMVGAWASANRLVLGQVKVDEGSNEITAIPELLRVLEIAGCIVTIDALGCQKEIARQIVEAGADYVLALKANQGRLYDDVVGFFEHAERIGFRGVESDWHRTVDKGHGRIEIRQCQTISDPEYIETLCDVADWAELHSIVRVTSERRIGDEATVQDRYYIASLEGDAKESLWAVRDHWGVENCVHWVLDIAFREDDSRVRKGHGAQNLSILRRIALNLLRHEPTAKSGVKARRLRAGWDNAYLLKVLAGLAQ